MERLHSEMSEEKDFPDRTNKRRISSILKAPRTPLRDLGSGNELIQECIVEKHQKNSRRVSFADTIRVFPPDSQDTVELNHAGTTEKPSHKDSFTKDDKLEIVPCEITGMNTLLHAPIQTSLQQTEVFNTNSGPEWNKMDKTLIFSEENEMDMTSGYTIMITHDIRNCQETENSGKIDFKLFSAELKSKEASQVNKFSFFSGPAMINDTCLSQHKISTENTQKVNFNDFLKSLKSTKQLPMPTADLVASEENVLQEKKCNAITVSKGLNDNKQNHVMPVLPNKGIAQASNQLGLQDMTPAAQNRSVEMFIANRERGLPLGTSVCDIVNEQENLQRDNSVSCNVNNNRVNASNYPFGIQLDRSMCINEKKLSRTEASFDQKNTMVMDSNTSLPCYRTNTLPVPMGSDPSMPVHTIDATTFLNISACMEVTRNDTGLICDGSFKRTGYPDHGDPEKLKDVSQLERTTYRENPMNISIGYFPKNPQHSVFNSEKPAPNQEVITNMELLKPRRNPVSEASYENDGFCGDKRSKSSVFSSKNEILNSSLVSKSSRKQRDCQLFSLSDDKTQTSTVHSKINRKSELSNSVVSLITEDKTLICSQNMEITKCTTDLTNNNPDAAVFQNMSQEEMGTSTKSVTRSDSSKTVVFSLTGYNEMEITKSYTVPVNVDMVQCGRTPQPFPLQPIDKTLYVCHSDMDETKAITGIIDQPMKNAHPEMHKQTNDSVRRTLSRSAKDGTIVFSLSNENAMEISRSHTVALDHDALTQGGELPTMSCVPSNKTNVFAFGECMDITNPVTSLTEKSLRSVTNSFAMLGQKAKPDEQISGVAGGTFIHSMREDTATVGAPQALSAILPKKTMSLHNSSIAKSKFLPSAAEDKTMFFLHNNDIEITKPIAYKSMQGSGSKNMKLSIEETGEMMLSGTAKEETATQMQEISEMEITRSHTVAVNHGIFQQAQASTQGPIPALADKTNMFVHSTDTTKTQSTSFVPVDKTVLFMNNNNMEITKSESDAFLKNSCSESWPQQGGKTKEITLPESVEDKTSVFTLHDDEMEITKCHTVAVNYDILPKNEKLPQEQFCQDNMDITGSHTVTQSTEENLHKNTTKLGKRDQWDVPSKCMVGLAVDGDMDFSERQITFDSKRSHLYLPDSHAKLPFSVNDTNAFVSYQDDTEVTNFPANTAVGGDLKESVRQEMRNKSIEQNSVNVTAYGAKIQDTHFAKNHVVNIYGSKNNVPNVEQQIQNSFTNSEGGEYMETTRNHTTGIECMHIKNNEGYINSQAKSNSELSASPIRCGKKLCVSQTEKKEYSTCSGKEMLLIPQEQQKKFRTKDDQLKSCISDIKHFEKDAALNSSPNEANNFMFPVNVQDMDPKLSQKSSHDLNTNRMYIPMSESKSSNDSPKKLSLSRQEPLGETRGLSVDGKVINRLEAVSGEWSNYTKEHHKNVESLPINTFPLEEKSVLLPKISDAANTCLKLTDTGKKSQPDLVCQDVESCSGDTSPELTVKTDNPSILREDAKDSDIYSKKWPYTGFTESASSKVPLNTVYTDSCKIKKMPLGIFPPKLPNKRKPSVPNLEGTDAKSEKRAEIHVSEVCLFVKSSSDKIIEGWNPSNYIKEELPPAYVEEMDSDESLNCNVPEKFCEMMKGKETPEKEGHLSEMCETNKRQRALNQEDEELQKEKKFKGNQTWNDTTDLMQPLTSTLVAHDQAKPDKTKTVPEFTVTNLEKTEGSSTSSSLESVKADADFSIQRCTEMETQFLLDSICEQNFHEKLQEGTITVREFFTLLEVHVLIQKPRQSQLPFKHEVNTPPTLEDEILSQYIYHSKLQTYEEDCQGLCRIIEELKSHAADQDKLLVNVHKSLWEVMRTCSDKELKGFGAELNKMKSCFTKKSKVLAHRGKTKLYAKLVQNTQFQCEKLQSRLAKIDELLKETDSCLAALETETAKIEECDLNDYNAVSEYESKLRNTERELENLRTQDETFQRAQSSLRDKKDQIVSEICHIQTEIKTCQELVDKYNFSEWVIKEWNDHQAVFTFLYDSIELTVGLVCPEGSAIFSNKIISVNFESHLDETKALPSAKLVHRLIFQFINSQGSWQDKCITMSHLFQMLHDVSLVVSRCQFLGDEIEFLNRWGGKYYLLKTELNDAKLKLLFSSCHMKFEIEFCLSATYPVTPIAFAIQKYTGNLVPEEISVVLSSVPVGANYLMRLVKQISDTLFQSPSSAVYKNQKAALQ